MPRCPPRSISPPTPSGLRVARVELAAALRAAALYGFNEGIDNHFSLVVPGRDDCFLLNPYGPHWSEMRASDLLTIGLGGERLAGEGELDTTAFTIHLGAHRARPDAACVLHTHMPYATALAMTEGGLDTRASQNAMYFHGRVARLEYGGLAEAEEEGARIAHRARRRHHVILMDNHGVLVVGESVADAWHQLYFLERACEVQVLAQSTGSPLLRVPEAVAEHTAAQFRQRGRSGRAVRRGATRARSRQPRLRALTIRTVVVGDYAALSQAAADAIAATLARKPDALLLLATGDTPMGAYGELAERHARGELDTSQLRAAQLDEYAGLAARTTAARSTAGWSARSSSRWACPRSGRSGSTPRSRPTSRAGSTTRPWRRPAASSSPCSASGRTATSASTSLRSSATPRPASCR